MKKILILTKKVGFDTGSKSPFSRSPFRWIDDCKSNYIFDYWGEGLTDTSLKNLKNKIDKFKPDFIYLTLRKKYRKWLPDLSSIKNVPKIFVEVDTRIYDAKDSWYKQFDILKCRCPWWNNWNKVPFFRWSVPEKAFSTEKTKRKGIFFVGNMDHSIYAKRRELKEMFSEYVNFTTNFINYWDTLHKASALLCPTESLSGDFIPAKLFEYLASGSAVITNCNLDRIGIPEIGEYVICYSGVEDLKQKLHFDFVPYHNRAIELMKNHTHRIRYKELFG